ncbi:diacylglycerol/lipid kinase family protein [Amycolatopsis taiwanensis]|uniref:diacylglycerol/lipid kinase family protein n=1 Tax=Amycolatopsis taiwanensis TaxID=342230 RepID=UPI000482A520|nr:diacylglycerol kinase family protein [Amycolatopsis taiwanensis]
MRAILVVNPQATSTTPGGRDVLAHALASQVKLEVVETDYRGHALTVAHAAARDGVDLVVAHGGDGTVNEVVNGLLADGVGEAPALGVVPGGSANVFARALGISHDPVEATHQLLHAIEDGHSRVVGLGRADDQWFTFNAGLGWDADVVTTVADRRGKQTNSLLYMRAAIACYFRPPQGRHALSVHLPGEEPFEVRTAFISNTGPWSYLGDRPLHLNAGTSFDTGLGLFALRRLSLPTVFRHTRQALRKEAKRHRGRQLACYDDLSELSVSAEEPVNFQVDGDPVGPRRLVRFSSVPAALTVLV